MAIGLLAACSGESNWTAEERSEFMEDCTSKMVTNGETKEEARVYCNCCLGELETKFETGAIAKRELSDQQMVVIENACSR